ncbi:DNA mismatch repair protein [Dyadobacter endophyticus]|uniref:DNA mismatch repair protein n=1 Tax=Dyadobacter endophyticus TaxID=1749036 RepID=A0ABQ1YJR8_9BACT|nr:DNA mismatch repair protein MutS [Dyadobacter endophyticus]GGH27084.1 DNA mismatch repair protein [Dyadobacter endophyticus]
MKEIYQDKVLGYKTSAASFVPELNSLSYTRLAIFLITGILIMLFAASGWIIPVLGTAITGAVLFVLTLRKYNRIAAGKKQADFLIQINEAELLRISNNLSAFPTGSEFLDRNHDYAADLDVLGHHSLYQLLNRTTTESGARLLAHWLTAPADRQTIAARQQAVRELAPKLDWRQEFQVSGMQFETTNSDYQLLLKWVEQQPQFMPSRKRLLTISLSLAAVSSAALAYFLYYFLFHLRDLSGIHLLPLALTLIINSVYLRKFSHAAEDIILSTQRNIGILGAYQSLIKTVEKQPFDAEKLKELRDILTQAGNPAAAEIGGLKKTLEMFQQKGTRNTIGKNAFYGMINNLWLIDVHLILNTEDWKSRNHQHIRSWIAAVSELEALASIAGFAHANPGYTFPEITGEPYLIDFKKVGHPLLKPQKRVSNDFTMNGRGATTMITGSNMAGKSTFLRTVGVNLVLASMGAPCCASHARVSLLRIFTSMRTQDNLEESVSSFYAELQRIEQLLTLVGEGEPIFFLLDEMFKGTNSQDRFRGGVSLIRQLSELNAFGMISTHDLDLAKLTKDLAINNFSFNSVISDGQISFDYQLTPGICTDFNASELMKRSGIRILSDIHPA